MDTGWSESASEEFLDVGRMLIPARDEIEQVFLGLISAEPDVSFTAVDIGCGGGWLSAAVLRSFPNARVIGLDGSDAMLRQAGETLAPYIGRFELRRFQLEEEGWLASLGTTVDCFVSSLVIHHLDGPGKQRLFRQLHGALEPRGALLIADLLQPTSEIERRYMARSWEAEVRRQSLEIGGDLRAYQYFVDSEWNYYDYPDPFDKPSPLPDQLDWLRGAGFIGVDAFWVKAGHAVYGGYRAGS